MAPATGPTDGDRRVVVTGMGAMTPLGSDLATFWEGLAAGRSAVGPVTRFDASEYPTRIAAEVRDFEPTDYMDRKDAKHADRFTQLAVAGARQAVDDASLRINEHNADHVGVIIGSGVGGIQTLEAQHSMLVEKGPRRVSPFFIPMLIADMPRPASSLATVFVRAISPAFEAA